MDSFPLLLALSLGVMGSVHCVAMCGGISCMLGPMTSMAPRADSKQNIRVDGDRDEALNTMLPLLQYNLGRISSYALAGFVVGLGAQMMVSAWQDFAQGLRLFAGLLLIGTGCYIAGFAGFMARIERLGYSLWQRVIRSGGLALGGLRLPFLLGMIWGWLPCGLVYSSLLWAGAQSNTAWQSSLLMFFFGLGTLPSMLLTGFFAEQLRALGSAWPVRMTAGLCIVLYGIWTILGSMPMGGHDDHHGSTDMHSVHQH